MKSLKGIMFFAGTLFFIAVLFYSCGSDTVAGGAGAGNPGKTTLAMIIKSADCEPSAQASLQKTLSSNNFIFTDMNMRTYTVTSSFITVERIHFVAEPKDREVLASTVVSLPLRKDPEGIVLDGPFVFNTINGTSEPPVGTIRLPNVNYKTIRIVVENKIQKSTFNLSGTFLNKDKKYQFMFNLPLSITIPYDFNSTNSYISGADSTDICFVLDATSWFANINTGDCINSLSPPLDSTGVFIIDESVSGTCTEVSNKIGSNIVKSGKLEVKQTKLK